MINKEKIREINELHIRCTNSKKGCDWVGEMGGLEDHLKSDKGCGFVIVECSNRSRDIMDKLCGKSLERRHLASHQKNECKYRPYTCEYCGHKDTFERIAIGIFIRRVFVKHVQLPPHYDECNEYPLKCSNKCGKNNIKRRDMKVHHDFCPLEPLKCPFNASDCCYKILRKDMEGHKGMCEYRPYSCEHCGHRGTFTEIKGKKVLFKRVLDTSHYVKCDQYPLECPNECGETNIKRRDMKGHRDICPLEPVDCPFKDVGCTDKIRRKDMEKHMYIESGTQQPLLMLFKSHQELMKANQELTKANQELTKANQELKTRVERLEKRWRFN